MEFILVALLFTAVIVYGIITTKCVYELIMDKKNNGKANKILIGFTIICALFLIGFIIAFLKLTRTL